MGLPTDTFSSSWIRSSEGDPEAGAAVLSHYAGYIRSCAKMDGQINTDMQEIGDAFGGRDHTTVLHACRKIEQLREESHDIKEDFSNLIRTLSS